MDNVKKLNEIYEEVVKEQPIIQMTAFLKGVITNVKPALQKEISKMQADMISQPIGAIKVKYVENLQTAKYILSGVVDSGIKELDEIFSIPKDTKWN